MSLIAVLQYDPRARARVISALAPEHEALVCSSWDELADALAQHGAEGCVADIYAPGAPAALPALRRLRLRHPTAAIIVYADFHGRELHLFHLGRLGVNAIVLAGRDDSVSTLQSAVAAALAESAGALVATALRDRIPEPAIRVVRWAVERAQENVRVPDLAAAFGVSPATLNERLRGACLPTAGRILVWAKLFRAARLLEEPGRTVEGVAYRLGYASGAAFRRALKRYTGITPSHLPAKGGIRVVLESFVRRELARAGTRRRRWSERTGARWRPASPAIHSGIGTPNSLIRDPRVR